MLKLNSVAHEKKQPRSVLKECRFCGTPLEKPFLDLGSMPLANSYLEVSDLHRKEPSHPLRVFVCSQCFLVQLADYDQNTEIFNEKYAYFSSYSTSWLAHASKYVDQMVERFKFNQNHLVMEIASNDGYLLQYFKQKNIPILGIEPCANVAAAAEEKGIPTLVQFFGSEFGEILKKTGRQADLMIGNNVLAHVPALNDFVKGLKIALKPTGIITIEFPHLLRLLEQNQFDTIYHEHFSYFSFAAAERVFAAQGLTLFDVEELPTHGGSLRIYGKHAECDLYPVTERTNDLKKQEKEMGLESLGRYEQFSEQVQEVRAELMTFLGRAKQKKLKVVGYGAPAKGNTLLNYCNATQDDILFTVDMSPHKQGRLLPGSHIPIDSPERIRKEKPDYILILPWNLKDEIMNQMSFVREWGGKFIVPIPKLTVLP